jgi:uncharacterized protein
MQRALVVSIHDVAPVTQTSVEKILVELRQRGVKVWSLLVVPDYHRHGRSLADAAFRSWLEEMNARGHEIVIHGFFHQRARRNNESTRDKILTRFYTADEGEFFDLGYAAALRCMAEARQDFEAHGFRPSGFVAPAWLLGPEANRAVIDAGMTYTTTLRTVRDFAKDQTFVSQSLVYSVRTGWRRCASLAWNRSLFRRLTTNPLLRLSIHPADIAHRAVWRQIGEIVAEALLDRQPMTYQGWLSSTSSPVIPSEAEGSRGITGRQQNVLVARRDASTPLRSARQDL